MLINEREGLDWMELRVKDGALTHAGGCWGHYGRRALRITARILVDRRDVFCLLVRLFSHDRLQR